MRKSLFTPALLLLAIVASIGCQGNQSPTAEGTKPVVQKWEYQTREGFAGTGGELNGLGEQGWEVCGVANGSANSPIVILKRPKL